MVRNRSKNKKRKTGVAVSCEEPEEFQPDRVSVLVFPLRWKASPIVLKPPSVASDQISK
jgi:hypothetical protein